MNKTIFIMLVGLPGSGKSTYAKLLKKQYNAIICSSDAVRKKITGDENNQKNNNEVFLILHRRIKELLKNGENVIYDATNIKSKSRRAFLLELEKIPCIKKCIIMATPLRTCYVNNICRARNVPNEVIEKMYKQWKTPYWFEGWNEIEIKYFKDIEYNSIFNWIESYRKYNQDNEHHKNTLGEHCRLVGLNLNENLLLKCAGNLHDCGKPYTKSFINNKGKQCDEAHYYEHHSCGAYDSLFFTYPDGINALDVSILINLHMMPYHWENDKNNGEQTKEKYRKLWGEQLFINVMKLHEADKQYS